MILPQALDITTSSILESRQLGGGNYRYNTRRRTKWTSWGRWLLAGILIFFALILMFAFLCLSRRRRRNRQLRAGATQAPMSSQPPHGFKHDNNNMQQGYGNQAGYNAPPPGYNNGAAGDYYGQQQGGVTQPGNAYVK